MNTLGKTGILLIFAIAVTAGAFGSFAFFFTAMKEKAKNATEITEQRQNIEARQAKLSVTLAVIKEQNENIEKLEEYFIKKPGIVDFTKKIEELGTVSGTKIGIKALTPTLAKDNSPILIFGVEATGKFVGIMQVLELLENFPAKIEWSSVKIRQKEGGEVASPKIAGALPSLPLPVWELSMTATALNFTNE